MRNMFNISFLTFQSTLPREERRSVRHFAGILPLFQSTLPREERLSWTVLYPILILFQSTLPREERHRVQLQPADPEYQFQSTLPREERRLRWVFPLFPLFYFNPRSHERSDNGYDAIRDKKIISIHAPTRGATFVHQ